MAPDKPYDRLADYYEWEHQGYLDDLSMYLGFAASAGGDVLEVACGTGRLLVPLAKAGHRVGGVDSSRAMLEIAAQRIRAGRVSRRAKLFLGDMRSFELGRLFRMAFVALGSFHHLLSTTDQRLALRQLARHLEPGGLLILDLINPTPEWLSAADGALVHQLTAPYPLSGAADTVSKFVSRSGAHETQTDRQLLLYDRLGSDGVVKRSTFEFDLRYLFRYEAEMLVEEAGFEMRSMYGGYDLEPYSASSSRMIVVADRQ